MPRFSVAFSKRKSAADELTPPHAPAVEQPSFRVIERHDVSSGRSFDGGVRMTRASRVAAPQLNPTEPEAPENMFADLKANRSVSPPPLARCSRQPLVMGCSARPVADPAARRKLSADDEASGSGVSNTTNATSTENSSRHSNASTAPSSTDSSGGASHDDARHPATSSSQEPPSRGGSSKSSFLDRATRTFSFGGQKKPPVTPPKDSRVSDLPPVLTLENNKNDSAGESRSRGLTASTASTVTPTKTDESRLDLGGDFASMFPSFDKRASMATLKNDAATEPRSLTGIRQIHPAPLSPDVETPAAPLLGRRSGPPPEQDLPPTARGSPPPVPRHQTIGPFRYPDRPSDVVQDEDAKLLQGPSSAIKTSPEPVIRSARSQAHRYRRDEDTFAALSFQSTASNSTHEDNMFEGSLSRPPRASHRYVSRSAAPSQQNKIMTPAEFEKYRKDKERQDTTATPTQEAARDDDDDDKDINYDDDDDEQEKSKQQARQRRKQEAHMTVYRQQMMKVTGEAVSPPLARSSRSGLPSSSSAPQLSHIKSPSPDPAVLAEEKDEDEDVPLGILQAHGFPAKNWPPTRLSHAGSLSNLRASVLGRPASVIGDSLSNTPKRPSTLPAFARNLPQDPFVGASIARPAVRESLAFGEAGQHQQQQGPLPPGGLVGVIASEERSRAMRRGSPSVDLKTASGMGTNGPAFDHIAGIPPHAMYGSAPGGMPMMHPAPMPQPMLTPGDQAQIQMTQQMQHFMQMQMQFMQMMAGNQGGGGHPMQPQTQPPYGAGLAGSLSMADLSSRHSLMGEPMAESPRIEHGRNMSMVQPSSSFMQLPQLSVQGPAAGYAPSMAPSERSNVGLPRRYRPVSQAPSSPALGHNRASTMSGGLLSWGDNGSKSTVKVVDKAAEASDEDDEQGWAAMKAKREKEKSIWKSRRSLGDELAL